MSDDYDDNECYPAPSQEPLNWADVAWALVAVPLYTAKGFVAAFDNVQKGLFYTSRSIDAKRRFAREAGQTIESLTRGER